MGLEIERKFLVNEQLWAPSTDGEYMVQGYIAEQGRMLSVRVRIAANKAWLNIKGRINDTTRHEYEYEIPVSDAQEMINKFAQQVITKIRYRVNYQGHEWEVDKFMGDNAGLIVAEIELQSENEQFAKPAWLGMEVTCDSRYLNTSLAKHPFCKWNK